MIREIIESVENNILENKNTNNILYHGTTNKISNKLIPVNPAVNWNISMGTKNKIQPSISLTDSKQVAKSYKGSVFIVQDTFNSLDLLDFNNLTGDAKKYVETNQKELKELTDASGQNYWATSKKAYEFLKSKGYDSVMVWDAEGEGGPIEIRVFEPITQITDIYNKANGIK